MSEGIQIFRKNFLSDGKGWRPNPLEHSARAPRAAMGGRLIADGLKKKEFWPDS